MSYRLKHREPVGDGIRRIAREQVDKAISELNDPGLDRHEAVHQFRKRGKKLRGLIRLVRPALGQFYQQENHWYRDAARRFSRVRDAEALVETIDALRSRFSDEGHEELFAEVGDRLKERRRQFADVWVDLDESLSSLADELGSAGRRIEDWRLDDDAFDAIAGGMGKTYRRACRARYKVRRRNSNQRLHEWRKRTKYHWYHMRLLRNIWRPVVEARMGELKTLSDQLGDDHDLAVFRQTLLKDPSQYGSPQATEQLMGLMQIRRAELQESARSLGAQVYAERPADLLKRFRTYWSTWKDA